MSGPRVAIGGFMHETNTFAPSKADYQAFVHGGGWPSLAEGDAVIETTRNVNHGIRGFIAEAERRGFELVPALWCAASPSAQVTTEAFETICGRIVERIAAALPLDAVYLDLHGAMVTETFDDGEGEILARVRATIGPDVLLVASLDLHGNVSKKMVDCSDALIAYRTYPHVDMSDTGRRAAVYMSQALGRARDFKAFRQVPFLIPIAWQCTDMEPCRSIYDAVATHETGDVATLSFLCGFPAADFADCGPSVVAYAATQAAADAAADVIADRVSAARKAFAGQSFSPIDGVREAMKLSRSATRPIVIADTQDNPGAGGDSDTTGMLRALVEAGAENAAIGVMVDPAAAAAAHEAGVGRTIRVALGGHSGVIGDAPFEADFTVAALSDGKLVASGPFYGRGSLMNLGPAACLTINGISIVVASRKAQMADQAMYRFVGIEPTEKAILVNKSSVHFRADFTPIAETILVCTAPGPMPLDPAILPFTKLRPSVALSPASFAEG